MVLLCSSAVVDLSLSTTAEEECNTVAGCVYVALLCVCSRFTSQFKFGSRPGRPYEKSLCVKAKHTPPFR